MSLKKKKKSAICFALSRVSSALLLRKSVPKSLKHFQYFLDCDTNMNACQLFVPTPCVLCFLTASEQVRKVLTVMYFSALAAHP